MSLPLSSPLDAIKGIGEVTEKKFKRLGVNTLWDLLTYYPVRLEDRREEKKIADLREGETVCITARVFTPVSGHPTRNGQTVYRATLRDESGFLPVTFFNNRFIKDMLVQGSDYTFYGKVTSNSGRLELISPEFEPAGREQFNKSVVPVYHATAGLNQRAIRRAVLGVLELVKNSLPETLPKALCAENELCSLSFAINEIHFPRDMENAEIARKRLVFEEFFILQTALRSRKILSRSASPHSFGDTDYSAFTALLPYSLTGAQKRVLDEIITDLSSGYPMSRLVQGDVGCGKTIIAAIAIFLAVKNGYQAAMMAPTEILATQHYEGLAPLFGKLGIAARLITGSLTKKRKAEITAALQSGEIQVLFGTHALIQEDVVFKNLALAVTDEQHRFGVRQRSTLTEKGELPHMLAMTATPIPRSLALVMYGDMDVSSVDELPPGRQRIDTFCVDEGMRRRINAFISREVAAGRQAYIVCPAIDESPGAELKAATAYAERLRADLPDLKIGLLHGRMKAAEKDAVMADFAANKISVLVSTTVIEVGVNVPNATMMIIENAERFGLSQLHQLRGRVGRGEHKSYCVLFAGNLSEATIERMKIMVESGDGLRIAEKDLELRGPGEFFGSRQHGLPELKIASLANDMDTLIKSGAAAEKILRYDPFLEKEENFYLKKRIEEFFRDKKDFMA
ncbi:MAG: ATP-dependent DNA helicase RecG [Oscillospiraceae bacterium]|nr:ATP-dependent DNA helicase RecG [Oscillospiraceae bacterium]